MTTKTIDGLRALLETEAETVVVPPALAARTATRAHGVRRRRQVAGGAVALALTGAAVVPVALGWTGDDNQVAPQGDGLVSEGWVEDLEGLDLPQGAAIDVPYVVGDVLVLDGSEIQLIEEPEWLVAVPDGAIVATGHGGDFAASTLELIRSDGARATLDTGSIVGTAVSTEADGSVIVTYGWLDDGSAVRGEIRVLELGSSAEPERIPVTPGASVISSDGSTAVITYLAEPRPYEARIDLESGASSLITEPGSMTTYEGSTAGGLQLIFDENAQCLNAQTTTGGTAWQRCDGTPWRGLSPTREWLLTLDGVVDAETGQLAFTFSGLPAWTMDLGDGLRTGLVGWESADSAIYRVHALDPSGSTPENPSGIAAHVEVRCSISTGACERIPHPIDQIDQFR